MIGVRTSTQEDSISPISVPPATNYNNSDSIMMRLYSADCMALSLSRMTPYTNNATESS